jgi:RNA polymerase sigma-70 factor (ECF subfamily)
MADISDSYIFRQIKAGDEVAFSRLFDEYYVSLCYFANKFIRDIDASRSVVQQVYVDLWEKREKIDIFWSVKSYMYNSVRNRSIDYLRKNKNSVSLTDPENDTRQIPFRDLVEESELNELINSSINKLPEKCREIFLLCRFEELKYSEIAQKLNISVKTVEMQIGIALKKLRESLSDNQMIILMALIYSKKN